MPFDADARSSDGSIYFSSVSGPAPSPRSVSRPGELGVAGTSPTCVGDFRAAFFAAVFSARFFLAAGLVALVPARRTLDFALFGVARLAVFLPAGLALALPRFELFLRAATRFFALAMAASCEIPAGALPAR